MKSRTKLVLPRALPAAQSKKFTLFREELASKAELGAEMAEILWRRDFRAVDAVLDLLNVTAAEVLAARTQIPGIAEAVAQIKLARAENWPILISGDYDADGISSTSILWRCLYRSLDLDALPFIPSRKTDGYGLNRKRLEEQYAKRPFKLLIAVDCGIRDRQLIDELRAQWPELRVVIIDHHSIPSHADGTPDLPEVEALIHPLLPGSEIVPHEVCAAALCWLFASQLRTEFAAGDPLADIELAAIGTVCDVMPLQGWNRKLLQLALPRFAGTENVGLLALAKIAGIEFSNMSSWQIGFQLGPRLNAAGRLGDALTAVRLLSTESNATAHALAHELNELNQTRQQLTQSALQEALTRHESAEQAEVNWQETITNWKQAPEELLYLTSGKLIIVAARGWEEGIVGLIAGKLHERSGLPTIVLTQTESGALVGSARSLPTVDITAAIATQSERLLRFGGHIQAAGMTVTEAEFADFAIGILEVSKSFAAKQLEKETSADGHLDVAAAQADRKLLSQLWHDLKRLEPYGAGFPEPRFVLNGLIIAGAKRFGSAREHLKLQVTPDVELVHFQAPDAELPETAVLLASLGERTWNTRKFLQLRSHGIFVDSQLWS